MLSWAIAFFILALIAAFFGFGGIASAFPWLARPGRPGRKAPRPVLDLKEQRLQRARPPLRAPVPVDLGIEARALG